MAPSRRSSALGPAASTSTMHMRAKSGSAARKRRNSASPARTLSRQSSWLL
jgi:hypothetical protein